MNSAKIRLLTYVCVSVISNSVSLAHPQVNELWVARYSGVADGLDSATAVAVDSAGNVYVTGTSVAPSTASDYATVKYSPEGEELWVARYDGSSSDSPSALALDSVGNAYVTGSSATVKYDSEGNELWVAQRGGCALALDSAGNVYVTGSSGEPLMDTDYVTVKYSLMGEELWVARYDGPAGGDNVPIALVLDNTGNVYVAGNSTDPTTAETDYATVKYSPEGDELWVARLDGPASNAVSVSALALDSAGNIYVTGTSGEALMETDFVTVKYGPKGEELWVARYDGPAGQRDYASAMALDGDGNIYVTGLNDLTCGIGLCSQGNYATVKYSPEGEELWVAQYDGPVLDTYGDNDRALALVLDGDGYIYVMGVTGLTCSSITGSCWGGDYTIVKYTPEGEELWVTRYAPSTGDSSASALALDGEGNLYVTGVTDLTCSYIGFGVRFCTRGDYATVKYSPEGEELWVARYDGPGQLWSGSPRATALDSSGNAYVTGGFAGDYATVKYSPQGEELWVALYSAEERAAALALAVDRAGSVYVTGSSGTVKYDSKGNELWVAQGGGMALAVDGEGDVYVTSVAPDSSSTIKYNAEGNELWVTQGGGMALALDHAENVCVIRNTSGSFEILKYRSDGEELWATRYLGPSNQGGFATALAVDGEGHVYVAGWSENTGFGRQYLTVKYSAEGEELWAASYDGPWNGSDSATALAVDRDGNIIVTGRVADWDYRDYATVKYSPKGEELWVARYDGPAGAADSATAVAVDSEGNIYVTGTVNSLQCSRGQALCYGESATVKYSSEGEELWVTHTDGIWGSSSTLALDGRRNVYVTVTNNATVKYSQGLPILPSDCNADGALDVSDGIALLGHLFLGGLSDLPCGDGTLGHPANFTLADSNGDTSVDISDGITVFSYLFLGGPPPALGTECVMIAECPSVCGE